MYVTQYLSNDIKIGKTNKSPSQLLEIIADNKLNFIPLFRGLHFVGNISEENLVELSIDRKNKVDYSSYLENFYLTESDTILEAIKMMNAKKTNILPVVSQQLEYLGLITESNIIKIFANFPFISSQGMSIIVSIVEKELSMTSISNIIESNNGKLLGMMIIGNKEDIVYVLVKFSSTNILRIGETFERFGYQVIQKLYNDEKQELLQSRYEQLLKYINI